MYKKITAITFLIGAFSFPLEAQAGCDINITVTNNHASSGLVVDWSKSKIRAKFLGVWGSKKSIDEGISIISAGKNVKKSYHASIGNCTTTREVSIYATTDVNSKTKTKQFSKSTIKFNFKLK